MTRQAFTIGSEEAMHYDPRAGGVERTEDEPCRHDWVAGRSAVIDGERVTEYRCTRCPAVDV